MRIRDLREDCDLTQQQVADYLHIRQNTYCQYETEARQIPLSLLIALAHFYNTSTDYLLGITNEKKPYPRKLSGGKSICSPAVTSVHAAQSGGRKSPKRDT